MKKRLGKNQASGSIVSPDHDRYRAEDDLRTLTRAEEIRHDKTRMAKVRAVHVDQMDALTGIGEALGGKSKGKRRGRRRGGARR